MHQINVPQLRFREFTEEWLNTRFDYIFSFKSGKNIKQTEVSPDFKTPCVRYGELYHMYGEVINKVVNRTNITDSELMFSDGDEILLPSAGEDPLDIGSASALVLKDVAIGRTINILKPINMNQYCSIYASYYINEKLRKKISTLARGASISNVYNSDLKKLFIYLPFMEEQRKIASFLTAVDSKIEKLTRKKELLEEYKKGVMQKLFSGEIRFKDRNGIDYPDWAEKKLGDIATISTGSSNKQDTVVNGDYKFFDRSVDILLSNKYLFDCEALIVPGEGAEFLPLHYIGKFDLHQRAYAIFDFDEISAKYLYFFMIYNKNYLIRYAVGSTVKSLRLPIFKIMPLILPFINEQKQIASFLTAVDSKIENTSSKIEKTKEFKKGLLQQMFV